MRFITEKFFDKIFVRKILILPIFRISKKIPILLIIWALRIMGAKTKEKYGKTIGQWGMS